MPTPDPTPASSRRAHEAYLRSLGLPLMIVPSTRLRGVLRHSAGVSAGLAVAATGLSFLDRSNDYAVALLERVGPDSPEWDLIAASDPIVLLLVVALCLFAAAPLCGWLVARLVARVHRAYGALIGLAAAIALLVVGPATFGSRDGPSLLTTTLALTVVLVGTYLGATYGVMGVLALLTYRGYAKPRVWLLASTVVSMVSTESGRVTTDAGLGTVLGGYLVMAVNVLILLLFTTPATRTWSRRTAQERQRARRARRLEARA